MTIFDGLISETLDLLAPIETRRFPYDSAKAAAEGDPNALILRRDMAFELGEGSFASVGLTVVTQNEALVPEEKVSLCGPDLGDIKGDCAFARVTLLLTDDIFEKGDQAAYALMKSMEVKKFEIAPKGYMTRPSALTNREQVRVSKKAVKGGLGFQSVGSLLIRKYHENRHVRRAAVFFVTLPDAPYAALDGIADRAAAVTSTLNHALADVSMNCRACEWKPVCDAVDGMKELHEKQLRKKEELF